MITAAVWIVLVGAFAYHNSFTGPFVFDDPSSITANPTIRTLWPLSEPLTPPNAAITVQGRPVLNLSLALNYAIGGESVGGYHALNLAIHLAAALTLFGLLRRTLQRPVVSPSVRKQAGTLALIVAMLWVAHPLQTQAVTYVIQRGESLMALFYLQTLYCFVRGSTSPTPARWFGLSLLSCFFGMGTKEVMVTAPLIVLLYDRAFVAGTLRDAWRAHRAYYVGLASSWLLLGWLVAGAGGNRGGAAGFDVGVGWWDYAVTQVVAIDHYLRLSVWPTPLIFEYGTFWVDDLADVLLPAIVVGALALATLLAARQKPAIGFAGLFFFAVLSVTSIVPGTTQMIVEHRMYLPLAAVLTVLVLGLHRIRPTAARWFGPLAAVALVLLTMARNDDYRSEPRLWRDTLAKRPRNALAREMHAQALERAGNIAGAFVERRHALHLFPRFAVAQCNLADALVRAGRVEEAVPYYQAAIKEKPAYAYAHNGLGTALARTGRLPEAIEHLTRAITLVPEFAEAKHNLSALHNNLGNALAAAGRLPEAERALREALRLVPDHANTRYNLGNVLLRLARPGDARAEFAAAVEREPSFLEARGNLGAVLLELGQAAEALREFETLIRLAPTLATAHLGRGEALFQLGRRSEAREAYERALKFDANLTAARTALRRLESSP